MFVSPMLASPLNKKKPLQILPEQWTAEIKYDGHRRLVEVSDGMQPSLFVSKGIKAWSRYGNEIPPPTHILEVLETLPNGLYDAEMIVPGMRCYGVKELTNRKDQVLVIFDAINLEGEDYTVLEHKDRRHCLELYLGHLPALGPVRLAPSYTINSNEEVLKLRDKVWGYGEEGLILKRKSGLYMVGKRSKDLVKIKGKEYNVLKVVKWLESRGEIDYRGRYGMVLLVDKEGIYASVKTKNNEQLRACEDEEKRTGSAPFIGRELRIEYQERTPDNKYREPRWFGWEDEL